MTTRVSLGLLALIGLYYSCLSQNLPWYKSRVAAHVTSIVASHDTSFEYRYVIQNLPSSPENLESLWIEAGDLPTRNGGTLKNYVGPSARHWSASTSGVSAFPQDTTTKTLIKWTVSDSTASIDDLDAPAPSSLRPGESIVVSVQSRGLPSIKRFWVRGWVMPISVEQTDSLYALGYKDNDIFKPWYEQRVQGKTISPLVPQKPYVALPFLDTVTAYVMQSRAADWIKSQVIADKYFGYFSSAKTSLQQNNTNAARATLGQVLNDVNADSTSNLTSEAYALIRYNTEYLLTQLPTNPAPGLAVGLINSGGTRLTGGSLQYYEGSWKDAVNNNDGTFNVITTLSTVSLRMTYAYGSQTKSNVPVGGGPVTFQTVNTQVQLQNSQGTLIDQGTVQYYSGAWRDFGSTTNGVATKELLSANYSFRMTYAYGSNDKQQDIGTNATVIFQTVNASVQLKNSQGTLMDAGTVQYYAGAWRDFGSTTNGVTTKELLPNNYSFRMTYAFASKDKQQNIGTDPTVVFSTVNASVQLKNSLGNLVDQGTVQYYAGAWRSFGTTTNGLVTKELLPNSYSFRMTYEYVSNDKSQDIGTNSTVGFSTLLCTVRVSNATGQPVNGAVVSYYSGAWRQIGPTVNGQITKELLPGNLSFRASYGGRSQDKAQNLSTNARVEIVVQ